MNYKKNKKAFSLIELSIVILIIGILVAGITQGSRLIRASKLSSAQNLTKNSPVASIPNLVFWIESTSEKSFIDTEVVDTAIGATGTISTWYDINPQSTYPNNPIQTTDADKPRYIANGINGLPVINFDGVSDGMTFDAKALGMANSAKGWTIYAVTQVRGPVTGIYTYISGNNAALSMFYHLSNVMYMINGLGYSPSSFTYSSPQPFINMFAYKPWESSANKYFVYELGRGINSSSSCPGSGTFSSAVNTMYLGRRVDGLYFLGDIAEIIIFNRFLKTDEHNDVREYLKKKWGVK